RRPHRHGRVAPLGQQRQRRRQPRNQRVRQFLAVAVLVERRAQQPRRLQTSRGASFLRALLLHRRARPGRAVRPQFAATRSQPGGSTSSCSPLPPATGNTRGRLRGVASTTTVKVRSRTAPGIFPPPGPWAPWTPGGTWSPPGGSWAGPPLGPPPTPPAPPGPAN